MKFFRRNVLAFLAVSTTVGLLVVGSAAAAGHQGHIRCQGNGDFCGASVKIAGGASNRVVTIDLTDTNFKLAGVWVIPGSSRGAFSISRASFRLGGSEYRFTLSAVQSNPPGSRIILIFVARNAAK